MAVVIPTRTDAEGGSFAVTWANVTENDTCREIAFGGAPDRSIQVEGTFGDASVALHGSNSGSAYSALTDPQGTDIAISQEKIEAVSELTRFVKPVITGGSSQSLTITLFMRGVR